MSTRDWFCGYVIQVTSYDRISRADHSFRFNKCITRAAASAIASNILDRAADEDYIDQHEDELNNFPDVKPFPLGVLLYYGNDRRLRPNQEQWK